MSGMKRNVVLALAVAAAVAAPSALATTGYFSHGYSMAEKGLAGTGVAFAQDSLAVANNPAGLVKVGNRMDLGVALFSPLRTYTTSDPTPGQPFPPPPGAFPPAAFPNNGSVDSDNELFLIPSFGRNWMLDANRAVGLALYANGGMNTKWQASDTTTPNYGAPGTYGGQLAADDGTAGVDLAQLFVNLSYAQKFGTSASWGASAIMAYQRFKAYGISLFSALSQDPNNLSNNGYDDSMGFGVKIGMQGEVAPGLSLGAQYQSEIDMSEFDKYKGLFADQGDFDIPATATIGLAWKTSPNSMLAFDIEKIWYSKVNSVGNALQPAFNNCVTALFGGGPAAVAASPDCLGGSSGIGFGWDDVTIYRLGYQWKSTPDMTWRVGYINNNNPINSSEVFFNILAPAVQEHHVTFGFTKQMNKANELTFAAMYSPESSVSGSGPNVVPTNPDQTIELSMKQYELGVSWGWKF